MVRDAVVLLRCVVNSPTICFGCLSYGIHRANATIAALSPMEPVSTHEGERQGRGGISIISRLLCLTEAAMYLVNPLAIEPFPSPDLTVRSSSQLSEKRGSVCQ